MTHLELTYVEAQLLEEALSETIDYLWIEIHASKNAHAKIKLRKKLSLLRKLNLSLAEQVKSRPLETFSHQREIHSIDSVA